MREMERGRESWRNLGYWFKDGTRGDFPEAGFAVDLDDPRG